MNNFPKLKTPGQKRIRMDSPDSYEGNPFCDEKYDKYFIIKPKEENKTIKTISPFKLFNDFQYKPKMGKTLKDGFLLIEVTSKRQSKKKIIYLINTSSLYGLRD